MPMVTINNTCFNVQLTTHNNHQHCLVWCHGMISHMAGDDLIQLIDFDKISTSVNVLRFDARSHGGSHNDPHDFNHTWQQTAADLVSLTDHYDIQSFAVGGSSMGAGVALWVATMAPKRVKQLILHVPPDGWELRQAIITQNHQALLAIQTHGLTSVLNPLRKPTHPFLKHQLAHYNHIINDLESHGADAVINIIRGACQSDYPLQSQLCNLNIPTLILPWSDFSGHSVAIAHQLAQTLKQSTLIIANTEAQVFSHTDHMRRFLNDR